MEQENEQPKGLLPLVDCDLIVYRAGFACKPGEPVYASLGNVNNIVQFILEHFQDRVEDAYFSISGSDNFRNEVATIQPYKGNRDPNHKPEYYAEIKEYLIHKYGAIKSENEEPDDVLGQLQTEETCIVSNDKDMLMIPGHHFIWTKSKWKFQTQHDADTCFWFQMMTGDRTDNIPGIKKIGDITASRIVASCDGDLNKLRDTVEQMYNKSYGADWEAAMNEVGNLLWIRRKDYKTWRSYFDK